VTNDWAGVELGTRTVAYEERDAILYALSVGAAARDLDLVFERQLRVLPTFALTLAQWAPDALGARGAWDIGTAVHGAQRLVVRAPLPPTGEITMTARVIAVWDKGTAAVYDVAVESEQFLAIWSIFAPGQGAFGGERGPSAEPPPDDAPDGVVPLQTMQNQAALYRLTGDRHLIHIDPAAAASIGAPRPILHGLCTLAAASLRIAEPTGNHPADLVYLAGRFTSPVLPGDVLDVLYWRGDQPGSLSFRADAAGRPVIAGGAVRFDEQIRFRST
jgi:acyl dehydratase